MINTKHSTQSKQTEPAARDLIVLGVDVGKDAFDCAIAQAGDEMRNLPTREFPNNRQGVEKCLGWVDTLLLAPGSPEHSAATVASGRKNWRFVLEATGRYSTRLATCLLSGSDPPQVSICNPRQTLRFAQNLSLRNKTDKTDARMLAIYGRERRPAPWEP